MLGSLQQYNVPVVQKAELGASTAKAMGSIPREGEDW